jgi:hypothetical protein
MAIIPRGMICGHRYQEGPLVVAAPGCECGTYAIGICGSCTKPVCGDYSRVVNGRRICGTCIQASAQRASDATLAAHDQVIAGIKVVPDLTERLLRVTWYQSKYERPYGEEYSAYPSYDRSWRSMADEFYTACPEYESHRIKVVEWRADAYRGAYPPPPWDSASVAL